MAILDHTYNGPAVRCGEGWRKGSMETIAGAFQVVGRDEAFALLDNGETGDAHGRWLVEAEHFDKLVRVVPSHTGPWKIWLDHQGELRSLGLNRGPGAELIEVERVTPAEQGQERYIYECPECGRVADQDDEGMWTCAGGHAWTQPLAEPIKLVPAADNRVLVEAIDSAIEHLSRGRLPEARAALETVKGERRWKRKPNRPAHHPEDCGCGMCGGWVSP